MRVQLFMTLSLTLAGCVVGSVSDDDDDDDDDTPQELPSCSTDLTPHLQHLEVAGLSAGIIKDGKLVCTAVAGHADVKADRLVEPDTVFAWASVSKTVTATAAMILHDDGVLDLDADINSVLGFEANNPNCPAQPITFRQLLTHTSSIVDAGFYDDAYEQGDSSSSLEEFVRDYVTPGGAYYDADDNFAEGCPGTTYEYSNVAVGLLGHAIERIAGMPFDDFCRERIFEPLRMKQASFHLSNLELDGIAIPHEGAEAIGHIGYPTYPDGLLRTSVPQLAKFLAMIGAGGELDGQRIVSEASVNKMKTVQIPSLDDTQGLLWFYDIDGRAFGHDGSDPGTAALMFLEAEGTDGVLLVANGDWYADDDDAPAAYALIELLFDEAASR